MEADPPRATEQRSKALGQASQRGWPPLFGVCGLDWRWLVQRLLYFYLSNVALDMPFLSDAPWVYPFARAAAKVFADLLPLFVVARIAKGLIS